MNIIFMDLCMLKIKMLVAFLFLLVCQTVYSQPGTNFVTVRVGLTKLGSKLQSVNIYSSKECFVSGDSTSRTLILASKQKPITLTYTPKGIKTNVSNIVDKNIVLIQPADSGDILTIESAGSVSKQYRGYFEVHNLDSGLLIIDIVNLEEYLMGVVPAEMPKSYPEEALKCQAIAARTYALKSTQRQRHKSKLYDLCESEHCQVYLGIDHENQKTTDAVVKTYGLALYYNNSLASVQYSSDCGGVTQDYAELYSNAGYPYLAGVADPVEIQRQIWSVEIPLARISEQLLKAGIKDAESLSKVEINKTGALGRILSLKLTGKPGVSIVAFGNFRAAIGNSVIKSNLFNITYKDSQNIIISGKGSGHGVGMCQTGTRALANAPYFYSFSDILSHYFPGTTIKSISLGYTSLPVEYNQNTTSQKVKIEIIPPKNNSKIKVDVISDSANNF